MNYQIVLSPGAHADIRSVIRWYVNIDPNLAVRFLMETHAVLQRITRMPYASPIRAGAYRRALLARFPYFVYYHAEGNIVTVTAIVHQRRSDAPPM